MMKFKTLPVLLFFVFGVLNTSSLSAQRKRSKVSIVQSYMIKRLDSVKSILFVYEGDAVFARKYLDLSKLLKRRFKKRFQTGFRYDLTKGDKYSGELDWIPKKSNSNIDHDLLCKITVYDLKLKTDKFSPQTYHSYKIDLEMIDPKTGELAEFAQLELESNSIVHFNNKAIIKLIDKIITE